MYVANFRAAKREERGDESSKGRETGKKTIVICLYVELRRLG